MASPSSPQGPELHGWRPPVDCVRANELCAAESNCSSRYRTLRQCLAGRDRNTMLANKECQAALEVLQESPLYDCRCKRGMKKELQCLQIYWSIHLGLTEGKAGQGPGFSGRAWEPAGLARCLSLHLLGNLAPRGGNHLTWRGQMLLERQTKEEAGRRKGQGGGMRGDGGLDGE